jgi:hypothetical protein
MPQRHLPPIPRRPNIWLKEPWKTAKVRAEKEWFRAVKVLRANNFHMGINDPYPGNHLK